MHECMCVLMRVHVYMLYVQIILYIHLTREQRCCSTFDHMAQHGKK